jgi:hypothetical protein
VVLDWLWPAAKAAGPPVATIAGRFLKPFAGIAERHPRLSPIVDHLGLAWGAKGKDAFGHLDDP